MPHWLDNSTVPRSRADWRSWLQRHHLRKEGVWVVRYKKASEQATISNDELVEEAIAHGWIDSVPRKIDAERFALWVAPRKAGSNWSGLSKTRAQRMQAAGLMTPAGQAAIDRARADGTWTILDEVEQLVVPPDLEAAFAKTPPARKHWDAFPPSTRRGILEWIITAKTPATRQRRIDETASLAQVDKRANQWPRQTR